MSDLHVVGAGDGLHLLGDAPLDRVVQSLRDGTLSLVHGALGGPVELARVREHLDEVLEREVVADRHLEGLAAHHELQYRVDAASRGQDVLLGLPCVGPDRRGRHDHVLAHLALLLGGELRKRRVLAHEGRERQVQTLHVDADGTMATLVGALVLLAEDDHVLQRAARVVVELDAQGVGTTLGIRPPLADLCLHLEHQPGVEVATLRLLHEGLEPHMVRGTVRHREGERPPLPLLGVEQLECRTPVLTVVEGDVGADTVVPVAIDQPPVALERTERVLREDRLGLEHGVSDLDRLVLAEATVHTHLVLTEALHAAQLDHLVGREGEGVQRDAGLFGDQGRTNHAGVLSLGLGQRVGQGLVVVDRVHCFLQQCCVSLLMFRLRCTFVYVGR